MSFDISRSIEVLSATPPTLRALLGDLSAEWIGSETRGAQPGNEHPKSTDQDRPWSPYDVVGHLVHGELTDWIPRARIILEQGDDRTFVPFDRFAQFETSVGRSLEQLLGEFEALRVQNIGILRGWKITNEQLGFEGIHPELGRVTLRQLLATWVVHDLNHIRQIVTQVAKKYETEVGVWREYLSILK